MSAASRSGSASAMSTRPPSRLHSATTGGQSHATPDRLTRPSLMYSLSSLIHRTAIIVHLVH